MSQAHLQREQEHDAIVSAFQTARDAIVAQRSMDREARLLRQTTQRAILLDLQTARSSQHIQVSAMRMVR